MGVLEASDRRALQVDDHVSALGRWRIVQRPIHPALRGVVIQVWHGAGKVAYRRDRILARTFGYLLINLGPPQYLIVRGSPETRIVFDDIWFSAAGDLPVDAEAPHGSVVVGVTFAPYGAASILPMPQHELVNRTGSLADLIGREANVLRARLLDLPGAAQRLAVTEAWLLKRCVTGANVHPLVKWATRMLADSAGAVRAEALAREAGCSRKYLSHLFRRSVGLTPKSVARIERFHGVLRFVDGCGSVHWGDVAAACGYYDQAHLANEFHEFARLTPAEFLRRPRPDPASVVVA